MNQPVTEQKIVGAMHPTTQIFAKLLGCVKDKPVKYAWEATLNLAAYICCLLSKNRHGALKNIDELHRAARTMIKRNYNDIYAQVTDNKANDNDPV